MNNGERMGNIREMITCTYARDSLRRLLGGNQARDRSDVPNQEAAFGKRWHARQVDAQVLGRHLIAHGKEHQAYSAFQDFRSFTWEM